MHIIICFMTLMAYQVCKLLIFFLLLNLLMPDVLFNIPIIKVNFFDTYKIIYYCKHILLYLIPGDNGH